MAQAQKQGIVWPISSQYRRQDYDLVNVSPDDVRRLLRGVRTGRLEDIDRLFRLMMDTWPRLRKAQSEIASAVAKLPFVVEPASRPDEEPSETAIEVANLVERALESYMPRAAYWELGKPDMIKAILDSYSKGITVMEVAWQFDNGIVSPRAYAPVPARFLSYPSFGNEEDRLMLAPNGINSQFLEDFPEDRFLISIWNEGSAHPIHAAKLRSLAKYWLGSTYGLSWLMQYAQLFGVPWRVINTDGSTEANDAAQQALESIGSSGYAVMNEGAELSIENGITGSGESLPQSHLMDVSDRACDILMLGQTLTTDNTGTGSRALGEVHENIRGDILQSAADFVATIFNDQLIPAIVRWNYGEGIAAEDMPFVAPQIPESKDMKAAAEFVEIVDRIGIDIPLEWAYETLGIPKPTPEDILLETRDNSGIPPTDTGDEPGDIPPEQASQNARQAMEMREEDEEVTLSALQVVAASRMLKGARHNQNNAAAILQGHKRLAETKPDEGETDKEWQAAFLAYGGEEGLAWAQSMVNDDG